MNFVDKLYMEVKRISLENVKGFLYVSSFVFIMFYVFVMSTNSL